VNISKFEYYSSRKKYLKFGYSKLKIELGYLTFFVLLSIINVIKKSFIIYVKIMVTKSPSTFPSEQVPEYLEEVDTNEKIKKDINNLEGEAKKAFERARYNNLRPDVWVNKKAMTKETFVSKLKDFGIIVIDGDEIDTKKISDPYL